MADTFESRSPQQPDDIVITTPVADRDAVAEALQRSRTAQRDWAAAGAAARGAALRAAGEALARHADEITALVVREVGKPVSEARGEVERAVAILHYYAQQVFDPIGALHTPSAGGLLYTERRPHGVAGLITPWNFPVAIPLWKAAPALATGNTVLLKPAPHATAVAVRLGELLSEALPAHTFQVLPGQAETGRALLEAVDVLSFTGSAAVGRQVAVAATARGVPVQAEMGGQNAAVVLPDADLKHTAAQIAAAAMGYAGQKCTATRRVIVVGDPADMTDALVAAVQDLTVGDPAEPPTAVGPVIDEQARARVLDAAGTATAAGGRIVRGGRAPRRDGWFVEPTVVDRLAPAHPLLQEETFGPLCAVLPAESPDHAVSLANGVRYGLVTSLHGNDLAGVLRLLPRVDTGQIKVNAPSTGVDFYLPFGGEKDSSHGQREQGKAALDFYSSTRTVTLAPGAGQRTP